MKMFLEVQILGFLLTLTYFLYILGFNNYNSYNGVVEPVKPP